MHNIAAYLEESFLKDLLFLPGITDISYNGEEIYYLDNQRGRVRSSIAVKPDEVGDFLRQIANFAERQFSYSEPILDVSFGRYRLNAVFRSLARQHNEKTFTFSLRIEREMALRSGDPEFFPGKSEEILLGLLASGESIVIGGRTSTGKTELEKYLIAHLPAGTRVIVIDNVEELSLVPHEGIDMTHWLVNDAAPKGSFPSLVANSLRNNPDYVVVAEARGPEMLDALISVMSGHPIITSVHGKSLEALPSRMARLAMLSGPKIDRDSLIEDINEHLRAYVHLEKRIDKNGRVIRFVESIGLLNPKTHAMEILFREENHA